MTAYRIIERHPTDLHAAELDAAAVLQRDLDQERAPDEPVPALEVFRERLAHVGSDAEPRLWLAFESGGALVGLGGADLPRAGNTHAIFGQVGVRVAERRRGLGRALVARVATFARAEGREAFIGWVDDRLAASLPFARSCGFAVGSEMHINQLVLASLDYGHVEALSEESRAKAAGYALEVVPRPTPEQLIADVCTAFDQMNNAPHDRVAWREQRMTAAQIRERDALHARTGRERSFLLARRVADGAVAGFTELTWFSAQPTIVNQHGTAVDPAHRGRGLGLWLKAANLLRLRELVPGARYVRTGNADSNAAMLRINHLLGFGPAFAAYVLQGSVEEIVARTSDRPIG